MKNAKKLITMLFAFAVMMGCMLLTTTDVQAAANHTYKYDKKKGVIYESRTRADMLTRYDGGIDVYLEDAGNYVSSVKVNKSGLFAKVTSDRKLKSENSSYLVSSYPDAKTKRRISIDFYATKKGKYTVTFIVKNSKGKKVTSKKVTVYAGYPTSPTKTLTYAGNEYYTYGSSSINTKKTSGKLKFKANSGYQIKKIEVATSFDSKGEPIFKKVKNGAKITLAKETKYTEITYEYDSSYGDYISKYQNGTSYDFLKPMTVIRVSYYDKLLKINGQTEHVIFNIK